MSAEKPIFDYICENVVDGRLPDSFCLSDYDSDYDKGDSLIRMADGAWDGICIYHTAEAVLPDDVVETIGNALSIAAVGDSDSANEVLIPLLEEHRAINLIDYIQQAISEIAPSVDVPGLFRYATICVFESDQIELVKLGLSILEMMNEPEEEMKEAIRTLGLSDEFTIFCAWNARHWEDGNEEVFSLARQTDGWGRIHAIEMLEPSTEEIKTWLLYEGVKNFVMPEYSALTCYEKADAALRLGRNMDHGEFSAITTIVQALLNEGPVRGISGVENPLMDLARYALQAIRQPLDLNDCECMAAIVDYADSAGWVDFASDCRAILESERVRSLVLDELSKGRGVELASTLGIP